MRDIRIDYLKIYGMFLIIWGHFFPPYISCYIYSISVPLFFFISGYLFKNSSTSTLLKKIFNSLLIPYLLLSGANLVINIGIGNLSLDSFPYYDKKSILFAIIGIITGCHSVQGVQAAGCLWFVYDLMWIKLLSHFSSKSHMIKFPLLAVFLFVSLFFSQADGSISTVTPLQSLPISYLFFELGCFAKRENVLDIPISMAMRIILVLIVFPVFYYTARNNGSAYIYLGQLGNNSILFAFSSLTGIFLSILFVQILPHIQNRIIFKSSSGTIITLAFHYWLVLFVSHFLVLYTSSWEYVLLSMISSIIIIGAFYFVIIFFENYFPVTLGGRR